LKATLYALIIRVARPFYRAWAFLARAFRPVRIFLRLRALEEGIKACQDCGVGLVLAHPEVRWARDKTTGRIEVRCKWCWQRYESRLGRKVKAI